MSDISMLVTVFVGGVVTIIGAVVTGIISVRNSQKASDKKQEVTNDATAKKLEVIHDLTNSNLQKIQGALDTAIAQIEGLKLAMKVKDDRALELKTEMASAKGHAAGMKDQKVIDGGTTGG